MFINQWKPKNNWSVCLRETILQPWDCLLSPIATNGKDEDGLQLEKSWPTFSSSHYELIEVLTQNLSFSRVQRSVLVPKSKGNSEFYLQSFDEKTAKVPWPGSLYMMTFTVCTFHHKWWLR